MFDLKKCMDEDDGKCICVYHRTESPARVLADDLKRIDDQKDIVAAVKRESGAETIVVVDGSGLKDSIYLKNLPKTFTRYVAIIEYANGSRETFCRAQPEDIMIVGGRINSGTRGPCKMIAIKKVELTEGDEL